MDQKHPIERLPDLLVLHSLQEFLRVFRDVPAGRGLDLPGEPPLVRFDILVDELPRCVPENCRTFCYRLLLGGCYRTRPQVTATCHYIFERSEII